MAGFRPIGSAACRRTCRRRAFVGLITDVAGRGSPAECGSCRREHVSPKVPTACYSDSRPRSTFYARQHSEVPWRARQRGPACHPPLSAHFSRHALIAKRQQLSTAPGFGRIVCRLPVRHHAPPCDPCRGASSSDGVNNVVRRLYRGVRRRASPHRDNSTNAQAPASLERGAACPMPTVSSTARAVAL